MAAAETLEGRGQAAGHRARIGLAGATAIVAGGMIGSGVYLLPAALAATGSISILGWIAASAAALAIAGVFAFLAAAAPRATGLASYVEAGLGRFPAAICAFIYWAECSVGNVAVGLAVAGALAYLVPALAPAGPRLAVTLALVWLSVGAAAVGPRLVSRIEGLTLLLGLGPVIFAGLAGWFFFHPQVFAASWNPGHLGTVQAAWRSALVVFWAFLGVECAAGVAGVVRDPERNVARASLLGVTLAACVYIAACTALFGIAPAAALAGASAPFAEAGRVALGVGGGAVIALCALLRAAGCFSGWTLVAAETSRTAADEGVFPAVFRTRPGERASWPNLLLVGGVMTVAAVGTVAPSLAAQFHVLADITVILALGAYTLAALSLIRLSDGFARPGRRWGARAVGAFAIASALSLAAAADRTELLLSLIPIGLGAALYLARRRR